MNSAVKWLPYCRYDVKRYPINQSIRTLIICFSPSIKVNRKQHIMWKSSSLWLLYNIRTSMVVIASEELQSNNSCFIKLVMNQQCLDIDIH